MEKRDDVFLKDLTSGRDVTCVKCNKGIYKTKSENPVKSSYFICDNCGDYVHITPDVVIE